LKDYNEKFMLKSIWGYLKFELLYIMRFSVWQRFAHAGDFSNIYCIICSTVSWSTLIEKNLKWYVTLEQSPNASLILQQRLPNCLFVIILNTPIKTANPFFLFLQTFFLVFILYDNFIYSSSPHPTYSEIRRPGYFVFGHKQFKVTF